MIQQLSDAATPSAPTAEADDTEPAVQRIPDLIPDRLSGTRSTKGRP